MASAPKPPANPFYIALVIVGVAFLLTACAYCVMAFRAVKQGDPTMASSGQDLMATMHDHGMAIMIVELVLLAIATVGAIGLDDFRQKRAASQTSSPESRPPTESI